MSYALAIAFGSELHAAPSLAAADWLVDESGDLDCRVSSLVPGGFEAYVRVLHPGESHESGESCEYGEFRRITWRETADKHGRDLHPEVQWEDLIGRLDSDGPDDPWPSIGSLPQRERRRLTAIAARHTGSDRYWLAWWNGYGYGPRPPAHVRWARRIAATRPMFDAVPAGVRRGRWLAGLLAPITRPVPITRRVYVKRARRHPGIWKWSGRPLGAESQRPGSPAYLPEATPLFERPGRSYGLTYSSDPAADAVWDGRPLEDINPQLLWPDDRNWIVATEIDLTSTYIAGSAKLADELMSDDQIEAMRVEPGHSTWLDRSRWR